MNINQFHSGTAVGDAITNQMLLIRKILRDKGYHSDIYAEHIPKELENDILPIKKYTGDEKSILFVHHSMGFDGYEKIINLPDKKALIYHNITPERFFNDEWTKQYIRKGLKQAADYNNYVCYCMANSNFSRKELIQMGYKNVDVLPVQISLDRFDKTNTDLDIKKKLENKTNIIFVGRVVPNKRQDDIIQIFAVYNKYYNPDSHLYIIGDDGMQNYVEKLRVLIKKLDIETNCTLTGKVSEGALKAYYETADLFLCMSEHEGFGVPLLEAMKMKVPVIAYRSSAIPETMDGAGIVVDKKNYAYIGALLNEVIQNKELYELIVKKQCDRIERLENTDTEKLICNAIDHIQNNNRKRNIQIQGPFETSYSLAIVNRRLAEQMDKLDAYNNISIYCTEGPGDYIPKEKDLKDKPHAKELWEKSKTISFPDVTIRNMYPPRVRDANGGLNFQLFGWEESVIPKEYIDDFNKYLNGIGTMSEYVKEKLIECGLKIPVEAIGIGVDIPSNYDSIKKYPVKTKKSVKFLHISSAFPRKGVDLLLEGYFKTFTKNDDVCLILKTFPNPHNNVQEIINKLEKKYNNAPEIEWINKDLKTEEVYGLYKNADCYVQVARGEGFGLPVAEAMLAKIPVIVSNNSGMADFCTEETALLVGYDLKPASTHLTVNSDRISMWFEPRVDELVQQLKKFIELKDSETIRKKVERAYSVISQNYTWDAIAQKWISFINEVQDSQTRPNVAMVTTWNSKCGIAEFSKMQVQASEKYVNYEIYPNTGEPLIQRDEMYVKRRMWESAFSGDMKQLTEELLKSSSEIIHFQFNFGFFELSNLANCISSLKKAKKKIIIEFHKTDDAKVGLKKVSLKSINKELNLCDGLIVHQKQDKEILIGFGIRRELIHIIPLGQIQYPEIPVSIQQDMLGMKSAHVVGSYGFLLPHKGIKETIEAVAILKEKYSDILYMPVCSLHDSAESKDYYSKCKSRIEELHLEKNVQMRTQYLENDESMKYLQACNVLVMPYMPTKESASGAIRFCVAARRPLVTTKEEIFNEFRDCAIQIESTNPELIAEAIEKCLTQDNSVQKENIENYIKKTSWNEITKKVVSLYKEL